MNIKLVLVALVAIMILPVLVMAAQLDPENPVSIVKALAAAIENAEYVVASLLGVIALIWILRKSSGWLSTKWAALSFLAWLSGRRGSALLSFLVGALVILLTSLSAGASVSIALVLAAILGALPAGWYSLGKNVSQPTDKITPTSADAVVYKGVVYTAKPE